MASRPRRLTESERAEISSLLSPLVERFRQRFGVARSTILQIAANSVPVPARALPADYIPRHPIMAELMRRASGASALSLASIAEDPFDAAQAARDAVIYVARSSCDLTYEAIGRALNGLGHDAVLDGYCRALGRIESDDRDFIRLVGIVQQGGRG